MFKTSNTHDNNVMYDRLCEADDKAWLIYKEVALSPFSLPMDRKLAFKNALSTMNDVLDFDKGKVS